MLHPLDGYEGVKGQVAGSIAEGRVVEAHILDLLLVELLYFVEVLLLLQELLSLVT